MKLVWIVTEKCWGEIVNMVSEYSIVQYSKDGFDYEEMFENEDLIDVNEMGICYVYEEDI